MLSLSMPERALDHRSEGTGPSTGCSETTFRPWLRPKAIDDSGRTEFSPSRWRRSHIGRPTRYAGVRGELRSAAAQGGGAEHEGEHGGAEEDSNVDDNTVVDAIACRDATKDVVGVGHREDIRDDLQFARHT